MLATNCFGCLANNTRVIWTSKQPVLLLICFYPQQHGFVLGRRLRRCAEQAPDRATRRRSIQLRRNGITRSWPAMRAFFCSFCVLVADSGLLNPFASRFSPIAFVFSQAAPCYTVGGASEQKIGDACGSCTDGSLG